MGTKTAGRICVALLSLQSLLLLCACDGLRQYPSDTNIEDSENHTIRKRPTVLLNRLMYALQNVIQPNEYANRQHQELERRGYPKHYWKCYFNAVSCFRRKREVRTASPLVLYRSLSKVTVSRLFPRSYDSSESKAKL